MAGLAALLTGEGHTLADDLLTPLLAPVPHRYDAGVLIERGPGVLLASLRHARAVPGTGGSYHHAPTGVRVAADARLDERAAMARTLDLPDTADAAEVLAHAYLRWGLDAFGRLLGDLAAVVHDPRSDRTLLVRDVYGMRPLSYRHVGGQLTVASDVSQLLAGAAGGTTVDERTVAAYLCGSFGPLDRSFHAGVSHVPPGSVLSWSGGAPVCAATWEPDPGNVRYLDRFEEYAEVLRDTLRQAVRARLTDTPSLGVLLSGGLDSGAVVATAGKLLEDEASGTRLHTYSFDYGRHTDADERHVSRHIVARYQTRHRDVPVEDAGPLARFPDGGPDLDDPLHGAFQLGHARALARAAEDGVARLATGARGDSVIGMIPGNYRTLRQRHGVRAVARELVEHRRGTGEPPTRLAWQAIRPELAWLRGRVTGRLPRTAEPFAPDWVSGALLRRTGVADDGEEQAAPRLRGPLRVERYRQLRDPIPVRWLVANQRRIARQGLEFVEPWSDRRLLEFSLAIPQQVLNPPPSRDKTLLRAAMRGVLPEDARRTAGKIIPIPLALASLRGPAAPAVRHLLGSDSRLAAAGWVAVPDVLTHYESFVAAPEAELDDAFWWVLSTEWWLRVVDGDRSVT